MDAACSDQMANPYLRILKGQLELYIAEKLGSEHLLGKKAQTELRAVKKEIADLKTRLSALKRDGLNSNVR
jgi:hypothetical protein